MPNIIPSPARCDVGSDFHQRVESGVILTAPDIFSVSHQFSLRHDIRHMAQVVLDSAQSAGLEFEMR
jgi:hypothetical protein